MKHHSKTLAIKILLVLVAEVVAIALTELVSRFIVPIPHTTLSYVLCGAILGYAVVSLYDRFLMRKKKRIEGELKTLTNVALRRYDTQEK